MFDKTWFKRYQKGLLWLLNSRFTRRWFRYVLRIDSKEVITDISPNSYSWGDKLIFDGRWNLQRTTDFRIHNKYSKRLFYAFKPLWIIFHTWDMLVANKLNPAWNLGFDTATTIYTEGHPETNTVDGQVRSFVIPDGQSWANAVAGAGSVDALDNNAAMNVAATAHASTNNFFTYLTRNIFLFKTDTMSVSATISSAVLSLWGTGKADNLSCAPELNIFASNPATPTALVGADFTTLGTTEFCDTAITYAGFNTAGYNAFTLNATGLAAINLSGISKFGARMSNYDKATPTQPAWVAGAVSQFLMAQAETAGTANDPKLVVNWSVIIAPPLGALTLAGLIATITPLITITSPLGALILTSFVPTATDTGGWERQTKNTATWTGITKHTT